MNVQELLAEITTAPVVKRAITNHSVLNEAYAMAVLSRAA